MNSFTHIGLLVMGLLIFVMHYYLSSRRYVWLGAIVPVLYVVTVMVFLVKNDVPFFTKENYPFAFILALLIAVWLYGYGSYKKKEKRKEGDLK